MFNCLIISDRSDSLSYYTRLADFSATGFARPISCNTLSEFSKLQFGKGFDLAIVEEGFGGLPFNDIFEKLQSANSLIEIIVISSSDSPIRERFALSLGILSYLRKPLAEATFTGILDNAYARIERNISITSKSYAKTVDENLNTKYKQLLLSLLLTSPKSVPNIIGLCKDANLSIFGKYFRIAVFETLTPCDNLESIMNFSSSTISKSFFTEPLLNGEKFALLVSSNESFEKKELAQIFREVKISIKQLFSIDVNFAISSLFDDLTNANNALLESLELGILPDDYLLNTDHIPLDENTVFSTDELDGVNQYVESILAVANFDSTEQLENQIISILTKNPRALSQPAITLVFMKVTAWAISDVNLWNSRLRSFCVKLAPIILSSKFRVPLSSLLFAMKTDSPLSQSNSAEALAMRSIDYLNRNYQNVDLSLKSVADHLGVSQNYLSSLFKKFYGNSFVAELTKLRMEKAKTLLLSTQKKVAQIADDVGFANSHYFSSAFKKYYGMTPLDMRNL